jgi:hypothetical protein
MKQWTLLGLLLCLLAGTTQAQRITSAQAPVAGSTLWYTPVRPADLNLGGSGARREFIFTNVISQGLESYYWLQASGSEFGADFAGATLYTNQSATYRPLYIPPSASNYLPSAVFGFAYTQQRADGVYVLGHGVPAIRIPLAAGDTLIYPRQAATYDRAELHLPFEFSFTNQRPPATSRQLIRGLRRHRNGTDSVLVVRTVRKSFQADAFGPLITPALTNPSVLRLKTTIEEVDSVYLWDSRLPRRGTVNVRAFELNRMAPTVYQYFSESDRGSLFTAVVAQNQIAYAAFRVQDNIPLMVFGEFGTRVNENHGVVRIPVRLTQPATEPVTARWSNIRVPGQATPNSDFLALDNQEVVFLPGQQLRFIEVPVLDDTLVEDFEQFYVNLYDVRGPARLGNVNQFTVEIQDNDMPYVYLATTDTFAREEEGIIYIPVFISEAWPDSIDIQMETVDVTAKANIHYRPYTDIFIQARPFQRELLIPIDITNDDKLQDTLRFIFRIKAVSGNARTGLTDTVSIAIIDDDARPNVSFLAGDTLVPEATNLPSNNVHLTVRLSYPQVEPVTAHFQVFDSTAVAGVDFEHPDMHHVTFEPGQTVQTIKIPIINNLIPDQGTRVFRVRLNRFSPNAQAGPFRNKLVYITENDLTDDPSNSRSALAAQFDLKAGPNPVRDELRLSFRSDLQPQSAQLISLDGRTLGRWSWNHHQTRSGELQIQLADVPVGIYTLTLQTAHGPASLRLLIER